MLEYQDWHCEPNWLGFLAEKVLGLDPNKISCRGEFCIADTNNNPYEDKELTLHVDAYTAWSPCTELFEKVADKFDLKVYWMAEELGIGLFQTNDFDNKFFYDTIIVDFEDSETEYFQSKEDAMKRIIQETGNPQLKWEDLDDIEGITIYNVEYI